MAIATIGGEQIECALPNFLKLEAAWPFIESLWAPGASQSPVVGSRSILGVVAVAAVGEPRTADGLAAKLLPAEMKGLSEFLSELMIECGLATKPGEASPSGENGATPSTAISAA